MKRLLVDSGPLIALFDRSDQYHDLVKAHLKSIQEVMITTWSVVTEVSHMIDFHVGAQLDFYRWIESGGLEIHDIGKQDLPRILELTDTYRDIPIDLADASLIILSEKLNTDRILSIDSDFQIFRNRFRNYLINELPQT